MVTASLNKRKPEFFYKTDVLRIRGQQYRWRLFMGWYGKIWENMGIYCRQHILSHTLPYLLISIERHTGVHLTIPYRMPSPSLGEVYAGINNKLWRHEVPGGIL